MMRKRVPIVFLVLPVVKGWTEDLVAIGLQAQTKQELTHWEYGGTDSVELKVDEQKLR
jgi:hypothetical protein